MTYLSNLVLVVTAMSVPHLIAAGVATAFPHLRRGIGLSTAENAPGHVRPVNRE